METSNWKAIALAQTELQSHGSCQLTEYINICAFIYSSSPSLPHRKITDKDRASKVSAWSSHFTIFWQENTHNANLAQQRNGMKDDKAAQSLPLHAHLPGLCQSVQEHTTIFSLFLQDFLEKASLPSNWDGSSLWQCSLSSWQNLESPGRRVSGWAVSIYYANCLGKTHLNGERKHPLARGPGLCEPEERS